MKTSIPEPCGQSCGRYQFRGTINFVASFPAAAAIAFTLLLPCPVTCRASDIPENFPRFLVPGHEKDLETLRELFWLHYLGSGPKATLWDEWLPSASLWPATDNADGMRSQWRRALSARIQEPDGYIATHQHASIAHQLGWPFPFWNQGRRGFGWHFSFKDTVGPNWRPHELSKPEGWEVSRGQVVAVEEDGWRLEITNAHAMITARSWKFDSFESPFIQLRWRTEGFGNLKPWIEWTTPVDTNFTSLRRVYFNPPADNKMAYAVIPMYRHPSWVGEVTQLRIGLGNTGPGKVAVQAFFSTYDTRHNINEPNFIRGCAKYFWWSGDVGFLHANMQRMRNALHYTMTEHQAKERKVVCTTWVGHDGRSGLRLKADGAKEILTGRGIGNNYWDLLPFGNLDCYATIQYYDALKTMARLEAEVRDNPGWSIPGGHLAFEPESLEKHANEVKRTGNELFWDGEKQRFVACVDVEGKRHDYGLTFLNCEAIYYDFSTPEHANSIFDWLDGKREIAGDTSRGKDIYHWRFAPRSTTKRNVDWYFWAWNAPERIPWGGQVQDGGAVLGFSYHELMARLKTVGPDSAWNRLKEIAAWFRDVQAVGGYRKYYDGSREGSMQGGGAAGGLGLDQEFFESVLVPQVLLYGFLGFQPNGEGFALDPRLPSDWPELSIDRIRFHDRVLAIKATKETVEVRMKGETEGDQPLKIQMPPRKWTMSRQGSTVRFQAGGL